MSILIHSLVHLSKLRGDDNNGFLWWSRLRFFNMSRFFYIRDYNLAAIKHMFFIKYHLRVCSSEKKNWNRSDGVEIPIQSLSMVTWYLGSWLYSCLPGRTSSVYQVISCPIWANSRDKASGPGQCRDLKILVWGGLVK